MTTHTLSRLLAFSKGTGDLPNIVELLYTSFQKSVEDVDEVGVYYELWEKQFRLVFGDLMGQRAIERKSLENHFGLIIPTTSLDPFPLIFCIQTYYSLTLKLLALQRLMSPIPLSEKMVSSVQELMQMESGHLYKQLGIDNFCQHDYFSWYLYCWDEGIDEMVALLITETSQYFDWDNSQEKDYDFLKEYYEQLFPSNLRHPLGEYFTPNWLVELVLKEVGLENVSSKMTSQTILDPTCGSGSFLLKILQQVSKQTELGQDKSSVKQLISSLAGFELNYTSTLAAKTNMVFALVDLMGKSDPYLELPIYNCDSLLIPTSSAIGSHEIYQLEISCEVLYFPKIIIKNNMLESYLDAIIDSIQAGQPFEDILKQYLTTIPPIADKLELCYEFFKSFAPHPAVQFLKRNIIERFQPLATDQFDIIVGNPPWVGWEYIPDAYREATKPLWKKYGLYDASGINATTLKEDISVLMTYVYIDRYLKNQGKLGFVIRQAIFKSPQTARNFRAFCIQSKNIPLEVLGINDLSHIKAFDKASNKAATIVLQKGSKTAYPVSYNIWTARSPLFSDQSSLQEVMQTVEIRSELAQPLTSDPKTRWISGSATFLEQVEDIRGKSQYRARIGVFTGGANAVYYVKIIDSKNDNLVKIHNYTKGAKRKVEGMEWIVERDLVYPVLKGRDIQQWQFDHRLYLLVPHTKQTLMSPLKPPIMERRYPRAYKYFLHFKKTLDKRKGFSWDEHQREKGFYSIMRIGPYTFKSYKIAWRYISKKFTCCVIKPIEIPGFPHPISPLPNDKLSFIATDDKMEAYFICGMLTSTPYRKTIEAMMVSTQISPSIIKHLYLPRFDDSNLHRKISITCQLAHNKRDVAELESLQSRLDKLVLDLLGRKA